MVYAAKILRLLSHIFHPFACRPLPPAPQKVDRALERVLYALHHIKVHAQQD